MQTFNSTLNPNLFCIDVNDVLYPNSLWTDIDSQSFFSEDCGVKERVL